DIYLSPKKNSKTGWQLTVNTITNHSDKTINDELSNKAVIALISYLDGLDKKLSDKSIDNDGSESSEPTPLILQARWSKSDYQQAFDRTQDYLKQGDCYQINLTQEWRGQLSHKTSNIQSTSNLIDYLPMLYRNTQAPFAGYLSINGTDDSLNASNISTNSFELLSCSPELFFTFKKDASTGKHHIITKPIKGTLPRGVSAKQDSALKQQLTNSEKDRAENVMIVDLLRNDLGKYARTGSVKVPQLFTIESFSNVHHMVSTITAELKENTHPLAVLFGSLPAGSITGTPKKRAVEIISELETTPRGAYCGTLGYMNFDGSGQWNVLIRTLQANALSHSDLEKEKQVSLWAGGGITIASNCDAEYQECLDKVGNLLSVLAQESLSK
ncbi:anthranilate synthase component I family protein, partial [Psychrobacter sp. AOP29-E1-7]